MWNTSETLGPRSANWKGGISRTPHGYVLIYKPSHPKAINGRYVYEHIAIAEIALGRLLPATAQVHHVNGNGSDNRTSNLVICENAKYHKLLHKRARALVACGHADWLSCSYCKVYGPPSSMYVAKNGPQHYHLACCVANNAMNRRKRAARKKEQA